MLLATCAPSRRRAGVSLARLKSLDTSSRQTHNAEQWRPSGALDRAGPPASHRIGHEPERRVVMSHPDTAVPLIGDCPGDSQPMPRDA